MPTVGEPIDEGETRWQRFTDALFDPQVRAGLEAAQVILDSEIEAHLDAQLDEPTCPFCDRDAVTVIWKRVGARIVFGGLYCLQHAAEIARRIRASGTPVALQQLFTRSSR